MVPEPQDRTNEERTVTVNLMGFYCAECGSLVVKGHVSGPCVLECDRCHMQYRSEGGAGTKSVMIGRAPLYACEQLYFRR